MEKPGEAYFPGLLLLFLGSFLTIVFSTLAPMVYAGDSSLFTAASYFLGTAHQPSYPLYLMLGKLAALLPFGTVAYKINMLSALFGALTAVMAYEAARRLTGHALISLFAPLAVLASPNFVLESSKAEVYTLNAFLVTAVFYLSLRAIEDRPAFRPLFLASFVMGLGMGNHHIIGFALPLLLYAFVARWKEHRPSHTALCAVLFSAGFAVYLYPYLRSLANANIGFVKVYSLRDFFDVFFRIGYESSSLDVLRNVAGSGFVWLGKTGNLLFLLSREVHPLLWVFSTIGIAVKYKQKKTFFFLVLSVTVWLVLGKMTLPSETMTSRNISDFSPYFLQIVPILAATGAIGLHRLNRLLHERSSIVAKYATAALLLFQAFQIPVAVQKSSLHDYTVAYTWIKDISKILKPKSFYLAYGDNPAFMSFYAYGVERMRDDVLVLDGYEYSMAYNLVIAPPRKFAIWYPAFYRTESSAIEYFYPLAETGRLYSSSEGQNPDIIKERFRIEDHVLVSRILPKESGPQLRDVFINDFKKIDYFPVMLEHRKDAITSDLNKHYSLAVWKYAHLLEDERFEEKNYSYRLALFLAPRSLKPYILREFAAYVTASRGNDEAERLLNALDENGAENLKKAYQSLAENPA